MPQPRPIRNHRPNEIEGKTSVSGATPTYVDYGTHLTIEGDVVPPLTAQMQKSPSVWQLFVELGNHPGKLRITKRARGASRRLLERKEPWESKLEELIGMMFEPMGSHSEHYRDGWRVALLLLATNANPNAYHLLLRSLKGEERKRAIWIWTFLERHRDEGLAELSRAFSLPDYERREFFVGVAKAIKVKGASDPRSPVYPTAAWEIYEVLRSDSGFIKLHLEEPKGFNDTRDLADWICCRLYERKVKDHFPTLALAAAFVNRVQRICDRIGLRLHRGRGRTPKNVERFVYESGVEKDGRWIPEYVSDKLP
jgi:hypothetical protein